MTGMIRGVIAPVRIDWSMLIIKLKTKGVTMKDLARKIDSKETTIAGYKNNGVEPPYIIGAKVLNVSIGYLSVVELRACGAVS